MPDYLGADQRKTKEEEKEDKPIRGKRRARSGAGQGGRRPRGSWPAKAQTQMRPRNELLSCLYDWRLKPFLSCFSVG